jgi:hypothetical protein
MFKQNQSIVPALQHRLGFFQRARMVEYRRESPPVPVKYFLDKKEIFLLASHQQNAQQRGHGLCRS